jgi:hypothetical protein
MSLPENFFETSGQSIGGIGGQITGIYTGNQIAGTAGSVVGEKMCKPAGEKVGKFFGRCLDTSVANDVIRFKKNCDFAESKGLTFDQAIDYSLEQGAFYQ